jgi:hypothetical protein
VAHNAKKPGRLVGSNEDSREGAPFFVFNVVVFLVPRRHVAHCAVARSCNPRANRRLCCVTRVFKSSDRCTATDCSPAESLIERKLALISIKNTNLYLRSCSRTLQNFQLVLQTFPQAAIQIGASSKPTNQDHKLTLHISYPS